MNKRSSLDCTHSDLPVLPLEMDFYLLTLKIDIEPTIRGHKGHTKDSCSRVCILWHRDWNDGQRLHFRWGIIEIATAGRGWGGELHVSHCVAEYMSSCFFFVRIL